MGGMKISSERVTPTKAKQWLELNTNNRPLSGAHVKRLAKAMRAKQWEVNGETIKFHVDGWLLDGQHRLAAIVESGVTCDMTVCRNINGQAFNTVDQGTPRTFCQMLSRDGEKYANELSTAVRYFHVFTSQSPLSVHKDRLTIIDCYSILNGPAKHIRSTLESHIIDARKLGRVGIIIGAYHAATELVPDWADGFWMPIISGLHLEPNTTEKRLYDRLMQDRQAHSTERMNRSTLVALILRAWNHYMRGEVMETCRITKEDVNSPMLTSEP